LDIPIINGIKQRTTPEKITTIQTERLFQNIMEIVWGRVNPSNHVTIIFKYSKIFSLVSGERLDKLPNKTVRINKQIENKR
jgi:hypothetical protein